MHPQQLRVQEDQLDVPVSDSTTCRQVIEYCLRQLGLSGPDDYTLSEVLIDRNGERAPRNWRPPAPGTVGTSSHQPWAAVATCARNRLRATCTHGHHQLPVPS